MMAECIEREGEREEKIRNEGYYSWLFYSFSILSLSCGSYLFAPVMRTKSWSLAGTDSHGAAWRTGTAETMIAASFLGCDWDIGDKK